MIPASRRLGFAAALALLALASCGGRAGGVRGSGTIEMDEVDVASMIGGRIVSLRVDEGDSVRAGDTLAVLDRGEIAAELANQAARAQSATAQYRDLAAGARPSEVLAARAELAAAEAARDLADANFQRAERLLASNAISQADHDRAKSERDAARARVRAAQENLRLREEGYRRQQVAAARDAADAAVAQLAGARSRAGELVLVAPMNGVVLLRNYEPGEVVPAGGAVLSLGDPSKLWMRVYVDAPRLGDVKLGALAHVTTVGARKREFPGRVVEIASKAEFTPRAALTEEEQANLVFGVKIALDPGDGTLKAGLPASARIEAAK